jgi:AraC family transcriptional activator of pobA
VAAAWSASGVLPAIDSCGEDQDNSCMPAARPASRTAPVIPHVALYGDEALPADVDLVHFERIPVRSSRHGWEIEPHVHDAMLQVLLIESGSGGEAFIDGRRWPLVPPCLVLVPALAVHGFHYAPDTDGPVITAAQRPLENLLDALAPQLRRAALQPLVLTIDRASRHAEALTPLFDAIARETRVTGQATGALGMSLLAALVLQIARVRGAAPGGARAAGGTGGEARDLRSRKAQHVERFRGLLDAHFRERWAVDRYARQLGVSAGQLGRLCREQLGVSPLDAINARVLHEAQRGLVYSTLSIKQVAAELGFDDEAYFGRFFKKHLGLTPTAFRTRGRRRLAGAARRA